jgi:hypothetical protein
LLDGTQVQDQGGVVIEFVLKHGQVELASQQLRFFGEACITERRSFLLIATILIVVMG